MIDGEIEGLHTEAHILWHISDYFSVQKADCHYNSPDFHFLGSTWNIIIYPNGRRAYNSVEFVSLYIIRKKVYEENDVLFRISIVCGDGHLHEEKSCFFSNGHTQNRWHRFMERRILTSNKFNVAPEGTLTIELVGTPLHNRGIQKASQTKILDGTNAFTRDFLTLLNSEQSSDVEIRVKSLVFRAHRLILEARSTVFAAMFRCDMKEKSTGSVHIDDCEPTTFQEFLTFIYTGKIDNLSSENVVDILFLSNKYDISDLKQICIGFIEENLSVNTICDVLPVADKFNLVDLKKSAKELFLRNKKSVMLTENWITFIRDNPKLATEILIEDTLYSFQGQTKIKKNVSFSLYQNLEIP